MENVTVPSERHLNLGGGGAELIIVMKLINRNVCNLVTIITSSSHVRNYINQ